MWVKHSSPTVREPKQVTQKTTQGRSGLSSTVQVSVWLLAPVWGRVNQLDFESHHPLESAQLTPEDSIYINPSKI